MLTEILIVKTMQCASNWHAMSRIQPYQAT